MKGVILGIAPAARIVDLTHEIAPQDVRSGALVLREAVAAFAAGTVHLAVVDPGVGSTRLPVAVACERGILVGPDNGLLALAAEELGSPRAYAIDCEELLRHPLSQTFHGRDLFAPVAAHLACGLPVERVGARLERLTPIDLPSPRMSPDGTRGEIVYVDRFGNLLTNIRTADLPGEGAEPLSVALGTHTSIPLVEAYSAVSCGSALAIVSSAGFVEIAVREGNARETLRARIGEPVTVRSGTAHE